MKEIDNYWWWNYWIDERKMKLLNEFHLSTRLTRYLFILIRFMRFIVWKRGGLLTSFHYVPFRPLNNRIPSSLHGFSRNYVMRFVMLNISGVDFSRKCGYLPHHDVLMITESAVTFWSLETGQMCSMSFILRVGSMLVLVHLIW